MSDQQEKQNKSRRQVITNLGASGIIFAQYATNALAQETFMNTEIQTNITRLPTIQALKSQSTAQEGNWIETAGFHVPGDGGAALYHIEKRNEETQPNDANIISLQNDRVAVLHETQAVNYKMFGTISNGTHDDGIQIKLAHEYANKHKIPVVNLSGEFWIAQTNGIPITTSVSWGQTTFHINERHNDKNIPRFAVHNDLPTKTLDLDAKTKATLIEKIKPGVQLIPELSAYAGHIITVEDEEDRIGIRAGNYSKSGWAREDFFYVEEEGRIIGDVAWEFKNVTKITATPCPDNYLIIEGGGFYFSGDSAEDSSRGYHHHGISIQRSRTIIREQWMGLEKGKQDISMQPRRGFYMLNGVYDVTLENIRAMPWEKNRVEEGRTLHAGTYGIGGARMLNCNFRNITAEGGWVAWGVFGTNLNKNFRVENCRLNRIDVHFHCWNLYISNCTIGFKGIALTGGGDLVIENTTRHGNHFVNFRRDYGAKWDGHIHIRGCTLKPSGKGSVSVLNQHMDNFDYQYPIGLARSIQIEDMRIDYSAAPESTDPCWLMSTVSFSKTDDHTRLFFPKRITFRNITVDGRKQGVRLIQFPNPHQYNLGEDGTYTDAQLNANCTIVIDRVQLEKLTPKTPNDTEHMHLIIGNDTTADYADAKALYPKIYFSGCDNIALYLGHCIASASFEHCTINTISAPELRGELTFNDCRFHPDVQEASMPFYTVKSTLGTRFTNCTIHAPTVNGKTDPALANNIGFLAPNKSVQHYHLNTALGNEILSHLKSTGTPLTPDFIAKLKAHHELEA